MSTSDEIQRLIEAKKLYEYPVLNPQPDFRAQRRLFVSHEVMSRCPPSDETGGSSRGVWLPEEARYAARQSLKAFIGGSVMEEKVGITYLDAPPEQIWELKVIPFSRKNQARLFGWFAEYNCFIGTHIEMRDVLKTRRYGIWQDEMDKCDEKRSRIFSALPVLEKGRVISAYLSSAIDNWER